MTDIVNVATVISTVCAIIGVPSAVISVIMFFKNNNIKNEIEIYHKMLLDKDNLVALSSQKAPIKKVAETFNKISCKEEDCKRDDKVEIGYYKNIKSNIENILYDIPDEYENIRIGLKEIKKVLLYCIREDLTIDKVSNELGYNYDYIETRFEMILSEINKTTRNIALSR